MFSFLFPYYPCFPNLLHVLQSGFAGFNQFCSPALCFPEIKTRSSYFLAEKYFDKISFFCLSAKLLQFIVSAVLCKTAFAKHFPRKSFYCQLSSSKCPILDEDFSQFSRLYMRKYFWGTGWHNLRGVLTS